MYKDGKAEWPLTFRPLEPFGAEVSGASGGDLASPQAAADVQAALDVHGVLVFREIHISDAGLVGLSRLLGEVMSAKTGEHECPEIATITLDPSKTNVMLAHYRQGNFQWHIDGATDEVPQPASLLTARQVDPVGGDTEFASSYRAWDALPGDAQARLRGLRVVHSFAAAQTPANPSATERDRQLWHRVPTRLHPLVWTRRSGRTSLLLGATADVVVDMSDDEGRALREELLQRATRPGATLRHHWHRGDLVIWDASSSAEKGEAQCALARGRSPSSRAAPAALATASRRHSQAVACGSSSPMSARTG